MVQKDDLNRTMGSKAADTLLHILWLGATGAGIACCIYVPSETRLPQLAILTLIFTIAHYILTWRERSLAEGMTIVLGAIMHLVSVIVISFIASTVVLGAAWALLGVGRLLVSFRSELSPAIIVAIVMVAGLLLFSLRSKFRFCYGVSEAVVGLVIALQNTSGGHYVVDNPSPKVFLGLLTASVYVLVRGFDNMDQGIHKDPRDPVFVWLRGRVGWPSIPPKK